MHCLLVDRNPRMIEAWKLFFQDSSNLKILEGDITTVTCDAIVSPANSFGFMDGGVDNAISLRLGWDLQKILQNKIKELPEGELLIGSSIILETGDVEIPYLISAPTMRVPTNFNIDTSINAYLAMKAALIAGLKHENIEYIAIPGLCTGIGKMSYEIAARQMFYAYKEIILGERMNFENFGESQKYHWELNPQSVIFTNF